MAIRQYKRILIPGIIIVLLFMSLMALGDGDRDKNSQETINTEDGGENMNKNPQITISMEDGSEIILELMPDVAPNTVNNFIDLVDKGFYDGLIFHRVIKGFMLQGGDPDGVGTGGPGYGIKGEFSANGFENDLQHDRGVISMARSSHPDSAGSQFFLMHQDAPHLDGDYAAFGKVIEGLEVIDKIAAVETARHDKPIEPQIMEKVTVETFGIDYEQPEKIQ